MVVARVQGLAEAVERSAAPAAVAVALDRLADAHPDLPARLADEPGLTAALVAVTAASRSLTELCVADAAALDVLARLHVRPPVSTGSVDEVRRWKRLELLRIAALDLLGRDSLEAVGAALARLAEDVFRCACAHAGADDVVVVGMGKLGGSELNYASDVDVMFVGGTDAAVRAVLEVARLCFRVDADLRPEGRSGPLTRSLESYEAYWDRWARAWEFQALVKARPVAGPEELGRDFLAAARRRLWERPFTADDLREVRDLKARAEGQARRRGRGDRELKRGPGGIRDVEFAVQLLQLVHGRHDPGLRSPNTLEALAELSGAGYVAPADAGALEDAYRFLRTVEHRLQLTDEQQTHAVPTDPGEQARLARVLGFRDAPAATASDQLDAELRRHQGTVRSIHERLFFRPLLEAFAGVGRLTPEAVDERLAAFGFADAEHTRRALRELTRGLTRSSRLMHQLLPLLLEWLSDTPDPDLGLLGLRRLVSGPQLTTELVTAFRESPEVARRLCSLLGTSRLLADVLLRNPDLVGTLGTEAALAPRSRAALTEAAAAALAWRGGRDERADGLRRLKQREEWRVAAGDVLGLVEMEETASGLTALAETVLDAALATLAPPVPFAVVALGRLGGGELSYASDLDVLFVYDGSTPSEFEAAERTAEALLRFVGGTTPAGRIYELDPRLRPEGKQGPLARSLEGYRTYYERWVEVWELQALTRARPVAGDADVGRRFRDLVEPFVWREPFPEAAVREIRRMKARVERERIPAGEDPQFHLKLGRGSLSDVEWTVQLLQLRHGVRRPGTMGALDALVDAGELDPDDARILGDAYRFCERARNRLYLQRGERSDSLPAQPEQLSRLARSLGLTGPELRESYRRVTRRARQVVERLFYGGRA